MRSEHYGVAYGGPQKNNPSLVCPAGRYSKAPRTCPPRIGVATPVVEG